jgi:hypothetical protein
MTTQTTNGIDPSKAEQRAERAVQNVAEQDAAKNNTSLAVLSGKLVNFEPQSATETWLLAQYFFAAKSMLPARLGSVGDVFMTLMAGRSLGLDAMTAIRGIDCVEGKVFIEGDLVHAMLLSRLKAEDGEYVELIESTDKGATYEFMKKGWKKPKRGHVQRGGRQAAADCSTRRAPGRATARRCSATGRWSPGGGSISRSGSWASTRTRSARSSGAT